MLGALLALAVPLAVFALVFYLYRSGKRMQAQLEADFRALATRLGLEARIGPETDAFSAAGTTRGVPLTIEVGRAAVRSSSQNATKQEARIRGRTQVARPTTIVLRRIDGPSPDAFAELREVTTHDAPFDAQFRTLVSDEEATRSLLDEPTRARLLAIGGRRNIAMQLAQFRCGREEVAVTLDGVMLADVTLLERAVELVLALSGADAYR